MEVIIFNDFNELALASNNGFISYPKITHKNSQPTYILPIDVLLEMLYYKVNSKQQQQGETTWQVDMRRPQSALTNTGTRSIPVLCVISSCMSLLLDLDL